MDDFTGTDGNPPDSSKWIVEAGNPTIYSNKLRTTVDGSVHTHQIISVDSMTGDFEVKVEITGVVAPSTNRWFAILHVVGPSNYILQAKFMHDASVRRYQCDGLNNGSYFGGTNYNVADSNAKLRIKRVGTTWTGYYWNWGTSDWSSLGSWGLGSAAVRIRLICSNDTNNPTATMDWDNVAYMFGGKFSPSVSPSVSPSSSRSPSSSVSPSVSPSASASPSA